MIDTKQAWSADPDTTDSPIFLRRAEASNYLKAKWGVRAEAQTLAKYAVTGGDLDYSWHQSAQA